MSYFQPLTSKWWVFIVLQDGRIYSESVFNETVNIVEVYEGLDGETFFLYVFFAAGIVLLLVLGQQALASMGKRRGGGQRQVLIE